jgi:transcriptional regulator with XRE-family HTH domain
MIIKKEDFKNYKDSSEIFKEKQGLKELLWSIRKSEALTLEVFSKKLDISRQHLCDIEKGKKNISIERAVIFAKKLGYPEEYFLEKCLVDHLHKHSLPFDIKISKQAS